MDKHHREGAGMRGMSARDKELRETLERALKGPDVTWIGRGRWVFGLLPSDPRCASCLAPFAGSGGAFVRTVLNRKRSQINPLFCTSCEDAARRTRAGVNVEMSMLFADIRGSTSLAESLNAAEFKRLIDRFYTKTTSVLTHSLAMIDKLAGDQVSGYFLPGYVGRDFARKSVDAAQEMLRVTGHADPGGPWVPVGVGINTGEAYFGIVGEAGDLVEITALGDAVNVAARLASQAAAGEILLSQSTMRKVGLDAAGLERRTLSLKGKSQPIDAWVMTVGR